MFARTSIPANSMIIEYTGDLLTEQAGKSKQKYLNTFKAFSYLLELRNGTFIDGANQATSKLASFMNHSCLPNCQAIEVKIKGQIRVFIKSICNTDI